MTEQNNPYDELRYYSKPFSYTSIALLEGNATLWGLTPPALKGAKVLELGSSFGGNLISQAVYYPDTEFVGIDLSDSQITQGNEIIKSMGLTNVRLEAKNILDITPEFGVFDYIIVHGIYSWVPNNVKDKILEICRENLTPNGIAYISYNTYPGWKNREVARDIMLYANKYTQDLPLSEQTRRGKAIVQLFSDAIKSIESEKSKNQSRIENFDEIQTKGDHYVAHEYLEYHNHPLYLNQFIDSLHQHQLAYIGDTDFQLSYISWMPQHLRDMINQLSETDYVAREQCLDYLYDVAFRRSLLCHDNLQNKINRTENIDKSFLDKLTFVNHFKENELSVQFNNQSIVSLLEKFIYQVGSFTIKSLTDYIAKNKEFKNITENDIYNAVLLSVILGYVNIYLTPYQIYSFEDNKTYVPKRFTQYLKTMLNGANQYIGLGNMYNLGIEKLVNPELSVHIMSQMEKPTTRAVLETTLKEYLIQNEYKDMTNNEKLIDEEYDCSKLFDSICNDLTHLGYIQPAITKTRKPRKTKAKK
ncbi:methyltransferase [Haemophilus quentini]|uniref:Methyltransferase n=1 Tax=Haemophilus quentini TaxID=123834 RepID=A0ABX3BLD3_9PAST|nr:MULTISPECIES: class I SAM-dependent methyltransferase [Haemophilus]EGT79081.1 putative s-adenosyl-L-methionine-dependent methyltransferase [Haemophilus haemolyticus M21639]NYA47401.1 methyltransferase regulatory domain-containing protein [Haemophilus haemolyticus]OEY74367.1 methyltransferase [Haemophilus quentini]OEY74456.1 methyltransferase [Haemophilus quentini]ORC39304.1 methyltransferase [Haemophilus quentini]